MPALYRYVCLNCGHAEYRYRNVKRCRKCRQAALVRQEEGMSDPDVTEWTVVGNTLHLGGPGSVYVAFPGDTATAQQIANAHNAVLARYKVAMVEVQRQSGGIREEIGLLREEIVDLVRQRDEVLARDSILEAQVGGWEAQCAAQVTAARAVLDYCFADTGFERPADDPDLEARLNELGRTIDTDAGRFVLRKLAAQGRQLLRTEGLAIAAAIALHELGEDGIQEHTRRLLQSAVDVVEWGQKELEALNQ